MLTEWRNLLRALRIGSFYDPMATPSVTLKRANISASHRLQNRQIAHIATVPKASTALSAHYGAHRAHYYTSTLKLGTEPEVL
eukprot:IDg6286t1